MLNLGCGIRLAENGFINVDKYLNFKDLKAAKGKYVNAKVPKGAKFIKADILALPFKRNYADYIESVDVLEHMSFKVVIKALSEIYRVLKLGGKFCMLTVDFDDLASLWVDNVKGKPLDTQEAMNKYSNVMEMIYGNQTHEGEFHKTAFNSFFLGYCLKQAGFLDFKIKMTIFPIGSPEPPPFLAHSWPPEAVMRSGMLWVEAIK